MDKNFNFQKMFESELEYIKKTYDKKPKLLLHACCAPCSSYVLECLNCCFDITLYYYNPNISPESEFDYRVCELERLVEEMNLKSVKVVVEKYNYNDFKSIAEGFETLPEGGERCFRCYKLRLEKTALFATENQFDYFTTTLTVSPYKNSYVLNNIGNELSKKYGIKYLFSDFKKKDGYKRSCTLSKKYDLYRQNYCGCIFSKIENEVKK